MVRTRGYQKHQRFTKRLEAKFSSGGISFTGISSNLSESGLFIRTNRGFAPDTIIDIELVMPDGKTSFLKGRIKRTIKTPISTLKNGMGIELIEKDSAYIHFLKSIVEKTETDKRDISVSEFQIISCPGCGVKNKVLIRNISQSPKCGRCETLLPVEMP